MGFKSNYWRNNVLKKIAKEKEKIAKLNLDPLIGKIHKLVNNRPIKSENLPF